MSLKTEILLFRGNLANLPLLPAGMPAFVIDSGQLFVGNGTMNVPIGGSNTSVMNADGTLTITPTSGNIVAKLNVDHANTWTQTQTVEAPTGEPAIVAGGDSSGAANIVEIRNHAGTLLGYFRGTANSGIVVGDPATLAPDFTGGSLQVDGYLIVANGKGLISMTSGGSDATLFRLNASDQMEVFNAHIKMGQVADAVVITNDTSSPGGAQLAVTNTVGSAYPVLATKALPIQNGPHIVCLDSSGTPIASIAGDGTFRPVQAATASAPAYVKGAMYFDTTLNKLMVGGAAGWETVTSV